MSIDTQTKVTHPALSQIRAYWEALRTQATLPARNDIDPRGIERALEYAFIAERIAPGVARFRLAGMHLNDLMGMEVRGMPLSCFFETEAREEISCQIERVFSQPAAIDLHLTSSGGFGRPSLSAKMVLLPLRGEGGQILRALGGFVADGKIGRAPRRFTLAGIEAQPTQTAQNASVELATGFAENTAEYKPKRTRSHLRLVHSVN